MDIYVCVNFNKKKLCIEYFINFKDKTEGRMCRRQVEIQKGINYFIARPKCLHMIHQAMEVDQTMRET